MGLLILKKLPEDLPISAFRTLDFSLRQVLLPIQHSKKPKRNFVFVSDFNVVSHNKTVWHVFYLLKSIFLYHKIAFRCKNYIGNGIQLMYKKRFSCTAHICVIAVAKKDQSSRKLGYM